jgi:phasin family protein
MEMYVTPDQVIANGRTSVEALITLANSQFGMLEKLAALNFNATKGAFEDGISHTRALLGAKDPQDWINLNVGAVQPGVEKLVAYSRSIYELATESHGQTTRFMEGQAGEWNRNLVGLVDKLAKDAPAGSDVAVAAVKSALAAANSAYDSFAKAAKQTSEIAEANMAAATAAVTKEKRKVA